MNGNVFISDESALAFWRRDLGTTMSGSRASRVTDLTTSVTTSREVDDALSSDSFIPDAIVKLPRPLHILVPSADGRPRAGGTIPRVWSQAFPMGSFWHICERVYVASPAFLFMLMASRLDNAELAMLGNELCGLFAYAPDCEDGFVPRIALTCIESIRSLAKTIEGASGIKRARLVSKWLFDRARSPMESELALRLSLAPHWGGYGIPRPTLNPRIRLSERAARIAGKAFAEPDLFWPSGHPSERGFDLEYAGSKWHEHRVGEDARRRNALIDMGIDVVEVSREQSRSLKALDDLAQLVRKRLGMRPLHSLHDSYMHRRQLHEELLRIRWQGEAGRTQ